MRPMQYPILVRWFLAITGVALVAAAPAEAGTLRGRVVDSGRGVSGATVSVVPYESAIDVARREARGAPPPAALASTSADPRGAFFLSLPVGNVAVQLRVEAAGTVTYRSTDVFDGTENAEVGDLGVSKSGPLTGRVLDSQGRGVADATVRLEPASERGGSRVAETQVTRTAADGAFRFDGASSSGNRMSVEKGGLGSASLTGQRGGSVATPIVLAPAVSVSGVVRRQDGKTPAGGVLVRLEGKGRTRWVETAPDGTFRIVDGVAGPARVAAEAGSAGRTEVTATIPASTPLALILDPPTRIAGRVVNARTLQPVPRVRVVAEGRGAPSVGRAGTDGRYVIDGVAPGTYRLSVDDAPFVRYSRPGVRVLRGQSRPVDIPLVVGATLSGRVVDEGGKPVSGAVGRLEGASRQRFGPVTRRARNPVGDAGAFTTAADGSFKAERLPPGSNERLAVAHPDFVPKTVGGIGLTPGSTKTGLTVVVHRGLEVAGTVRDSGGRAVPEAGIQLRPSASEGRAGGRFAFGPGPGRSPEGRQATSGADGRFRVAGLEAGAYTLEAHRDGFADAHIDVIRLDADAVPPAVDVWMLPGATISGFVHRPDGSGAKGLVVRAQAGAATARPFGGGARPPDATGDDGAFTIEGLQAGETYTLTVFGGGRGPEEHAGIQAPATNVEISVGGAGQIAGHVVDTQTQKPVTAFTATYEADRGSGGPGRGFGGRMGPRGGRPPLADDAESVDPEPPPADGSFVIEDVPTGSWTVVVDADAYETARVSGVSVKEGEATPDVEVRVTRGRVLSGRTIDAASGQPIPGVSVTAASAGGGAGAFGQPAAVTDADGHFDLVGLAVGTYRVQAQHPDYADASQIVDVQQSTAATEIRLSSGGTLAGLVVSAGGAPVVGADVDIRSGGGGGPRFGGGGGGQPSTVSDAAGAFHFDRLTAGVYAVSATLGSQTGAPVDVPLLAGQSRQDVRVVIGGGATLRGQVTGLGDSFRGSVNVMANGSDGYFATARPTLDGAFSLSGVPEGTVHVRATAGTPATGTRTASIDVDVAAGQTEAQADLVFTDGFSLSGTVTRGGQPVSGVGVSARIAGQGPSGTSRTDDGGSYSIVGLGPDAYSIQASPPRGAARQQTVTMSGDQTLDFVLPLAGIAGVVVEAGSGKPLSGAKVTAQAGDGAGGRGAGAVTDSNGAFSIDGLEPQPYALLVNHDGYKYDRRTVDAGGDGSDGLRIELAQAPALQVSAFDGTLGVPAPLSQLFAEVHDATGATVYSDSIRLADGSGTISLPVGNYWVQLSSFACRCAPFRSQVPVPGPALNVVLTAGGTVKISAGSMPLPATVHLQGFPFRDLVITVASAQQPTKIDNVSPGTFSLMVEPSGAKQPVTVTEGQTTNVNLQ